MLFCSASVIRMLVTASSAVTVVGLSTILSQVFAFDRINDPSSPDAAAAGGFCLVRRSTYEAAGGHAAVRREIIEDVQLARRVKGAGGRLSVRPAFGLASTHVYGSLADIWRGLRKNAYAGMDYQFHKYIAGSIVALVMAWAPATWGSRVEGNR